MPQIIRTAGEEFLFYTQKEWGSRTTNPGRDSDNQPEPKGYLHHEGGGISSDLWSVEVEKMKMRNLQAYSIDSANQGWSDIPYNICVMPSGRVYEGRGWGRQSAATLNENTESKAVLIVGNYDKQNTFATQINSAALVFSWGVDIGELEKGVRILGHRESPDHPGATSCPGAKVNMDIFRVLVNQKLTYRPIVVGPLVALEDDMGMYFAVPPRSVKQGWEHPVYPNIFVGYKLMDSGRVRWVKDAESKVAGFDIKSLPQRPWSYVAETPREPGYDVEPGV